MSPLRQSRRPDAAVMPSRLPRRPDLNVTPLIDVLLVLLVIFMAALPMTQKGTDVDIPTAAGGEPPVGQIVVEVTADRRIAVNRQPVEAAGLPAALREAFARRREKTLFLIGDPALPYREVVAVIDAARGAGVERVGVVTDGMRAAAAAAAGS